MEARSIITTVKDDMARNIISKAVERCGLKEQSCFQDLPQVMVITEDERELGVCADIGAGTTVDILIWRSEAALRHTEVFSYAEW